MAMGRPRPLGRSMSRLRNRNKSCGIVCGYDATPGRDPVATQPWVHHPHGPGWTSDPSAGGGGGRSAGVPRPRVRCRPDPHRRAGGDAVSDGYRWSACLWWTGDIATACPAGVDMVLARGIPLSIVSEALAAATVPASDLPMPARSPWHGRRCVPGPAGASWSTGSGTHSAMAFRWTAPASPGRAGPTSHPAAAPGAASPAPAARPRSPATSRSPWPCHPHGRRRGPRGC